jgi:hypothetical protein
MEPQRINEIGGWITTKKAMEMLEVSRERVMSRIRNREITIAYWEDRLMLSKADVERIAATPRRTGRPRTRPITTHE